MPCTSASQAATFLLPPNTFVRTLATHSPTAHILLCHKVRLTKESQNSLGKGEPPPMVKLGSSSRLHSSPSCNAQRWPRLSGGRACVQQSTSKDHSSPKPGLAGVLLVGRLPSSWLSNCYPDPLQCYKAPTSNLGLAVP